MSESATAPAERKLTFAAMLADPRLWLMTGFGLPNSPRSLFVVWLFGVCLLSATPARAASPHPTPPLFVSDNYGIVVSIPAGLFRCSYPAKWVGDDSGIMIYLTRPAACDPSAPVAADEETLPRIAVFYAHNVAEYAQHDGTVRPPKKNQELLTQSCSSPQMPVAAGLMLMGAPAGGCLKTAGTHVHLVIGSLYSEDPSEEETAPDGLLLLSLDTTIERYFLDLGVYRKIAASINLCEVSGGVTLPSRPPCPQQSPW